MPRFGRTEQVAIALIFLIGMFVADCSGGKDKRIFGSIAGREFIPAHWTYSTTTDSKGHSHTTSTYHPDDYSLIVRRTDGKVSKIDANRASYYLAHENDSISYPVRVGCMSNMEYGGSYYR